MNLGGKKERKKEEKREIAVKRKGVTDGRIKREMDKREERMKRERNSEAQMGMRERERERERERIEVLV